MTNSWSEKLSEFGLEAYNSNQFSEAIKYLQAAVKEQVSTASLNQTHWQSRFYLGCAYYQSGKLLQSLLEFSVVERCSLDDELKTKAGAAVVNLKRITSSGIPKPLPK